MNRRRAIATVSGVLVLVAAAPVAARAADPGRWRQTGLSRIPFVYYQGVATDDLGHLWFDGITFGLFRSDYKLRQQAGTNDVLPSQVTAKEGYNHIGDIAWDGRTGGRVLLPLECYYPGRPGGANSCGTGSFGVADPMTLRWRYYVKLDPAQIPKAMWVEESPDGRLLWTSAGNDLLAYRTKDVSPAHAAPKAAPIRAVRRLSGAVPPSGITGATFYGGRLFLAGQQDDTFQVWSVDLRTGHRRLEIERQIAGESEGLVTVRALGGVLHWIVTPVDPGGRPPTYGFGTNVLLNFVPTRAPAIRLRARPARLVAGRRTRVRFTATTVGAALHSPLAGALVRFGGRSARTSARGVAQISVRFAGTGSRRATATLAGLRRGTVTLRVVRAAG